MFEFTQEDIWEAMRFLGIEDEAAACAWLHEEAMMREDVEVARLAGFFD